MSRPCVVQPLERELHERQGTGLRAGLLQNSVHQFRVGFEPGGTGWALDHRRQGARARYSQREATRPQPLRQALKTCAVLVIVRAQGEHETHAARCGDCIDERNEGGPVLFRHPRRE